MEHSTIPAFSNVMKSLNISENVDILQKYWELSQTVFSIENINFLKKDYIIEVNKILQLPNEALKAFFDVQTLIKNSPDLARFIWHCHYLLFYTADYPDDNILKWPSLKTSMGNQAGMFAAILCVSGIPTAIQCHKEKNIPYEITIDTLSDIKHRMKYYYDRNGTWGLEPLRWFMLHIRGKLYKLSRLQFVLNSINDNEKVFRNILNKMVVVISEAGVKYRSDGQIDGTNDVYDNEGSWISNLTIDGKYITGSVINPNGYAMKQVIKLNSTKWRQVVNKGDAVLQIHIPVGGKMDFEECGNAFYKAMDFFPKFFPEKPFIGFHCNSWLLDSQFENMLSPDSNIVKFLKEFYLLPFLSNDSYAMKVIFQGKPSDFKVAPRNTQLQRAVAEHYLSGKHLRRMKGFILKDDLDWGKQAYRQNYNNYLYDYLFR